MIVQKTWYGYKEITSPKVVDGNYYPSYWFSPIRFYDIPQNTQLALEIYLDRYVTSEFGGNIYDTEPKVIIIIHLLGKGVFPMDRFEPG
ncbi:MAG: hypothetical protein ACPLXA_08410 [Moorellaceae bacterium]